MGWYLDSLDGRLNAREPLIVTETWQIWTLGKIPRCRTTRFISKIGLPGKSGIESTEPDVRFFSQDWFEWQIKIMTLTKAACAEPRV